jgi:hypothetical protein
MSSPYDHKAVPGPKLDDKSSVIFKKSRAWPFKFLAGNSDSQASRASPTLRLAGIAGLLDSQASMRLIDQPESLGLAGRD